MKAFITTVMINNLAADYEIFAFGKKFKAVLMQSYLGNCLPCQLTFWKEKGAWKTYHPLTQHEIYLFGAAIDNHLTTEEVKNLKNAAAA